MNWNTIGAEGAVAAAGPQLMAASTQASGGGAATSACDEAEGSRQQEVSLASLLMRSQLDFTEQHERALPAREGTGMAPELSSTSTTSKRRAIKRGMRTS